jgi:hypothetical protein
MLIVNRDADALLVRAATRATLLGEPFECLADYVRRMAAEEAAAKILPFADWREKLRPASTTTTEPTSTLR